MLLLTLSALAKSWCADPLVAHEWGVTVLTADASAPAKPALPDHFHTPGDPFAVANAPVRTLPPDSGVRTLPVVHFYGPSPRRDTIPLAAEVGFRDGEASVWYPAVDRRIPYAETKSDEALAQREFLEAARAKLQPHGPREDLGPDPTRQLHWTALQLTEDATGRPVKTDSDWVNAARALPNALWVNQGTESERFLFYEADTVEKPAVTATFGRSWTIRNTSDQTVHDVLVFANGDFTMIPALPPGQALNASHQPIRPAFLKAVLKKRWATDDAPPLERDWTHEDCVMMRDPMIPVESGIDHRVYPAEFELLWSVWGERLLSDTPHLIYREDTAALDAAMPVSLYTDMYNDIRLSRLGLVVVENLEAP